MIFVKHITLSPVAEINGILRFKKKNPDEPSTTGKIPKDCSFSGNKAV